MKVITVVLLKVSVMFLNSFLHGSSLLEIKGQFEDKVRQ